MEHTPSNLKTNFLVNDWSAYPPQGNPLQNYGFNLPSREIDGWGGRLTSRLAIEFVAPKRCCVERISTFSNARRCFG